MDRSLLAVIFGTFTLRLATGPHGRDARLLPRQAPGARRSRSTRRRSASSRALFYAQRARRCSPLFGVLSDRVGHHRVMLIGPAFGGDRGDHHGAHRRTSPCSAGRGSWRARRPRRRVPSILGFIAFATAGNEVLRGKAVARFEAATLAGLWSASSLAAPLFDALGPTAFLLNALVYGVVVPRSTASASRTPTRSARAAPAAAHDPRWTSALREAPRGSSHVWLLAPTWIAINAVDRPVVQPDAVPVRREPNPRVPEPGPDARLQRRSSLARRGRHRRLLFFAPGCSTGATGSGRCGGRRSSCTGSWAGRCSLGGVRDQPRGRAWRPCAGAAVVAVRRACSCSRARRRRRIGLLADMTEAYPDDRGAIMGLYSVFLGLGQIIGSLVGGEAAEWRGPRRDLRRRRSSCSGSRCCRCRSSGATSTASRHRAGPARAARGREPGRWLTRAGPRRWSPRGSLAGPAARSSRRTTSRRPPG